MLRQSRQGVEFPRPGAYLLACIPAWVLYPAEALYLQRMSLRGILRDQ
jgi:hypothetical protein